MKAIILAAGKGTRLRPLTLEVPKAMVEVHGKSLLEYNMEKLLPYVDEFIIVVKYKKEAIISHFGDEFRGIKVSYHEQGEEHGTGAAIKGIKVKGDIVIAYADAIISHEDVDTVMQETDHSVLVKEVSNPEKYGIFEVDEDGYAVQVIEKPQEYVGNLANFSFFKVNDSILDYVEKVQLSPRGEIELTDAINMFVKDYKLKLIHLKHDIIDITSLKDLKKANTLEKPKLGETLFLENIGDFELHIGFPQSELSEIVRYSQDTTDTALQEGTGDKKRFTSVEKLSSWYNDEGRYPFSLLTQEGKIAGIWWGRPTQAPNITEVLNQELYKTLQNNIKNTHTSGVRIYPFARGMRLGSPFLSTCTRYYDSIYDNIHMCIDIDEENIPSIKASEKIGFQKVGYGKNINNSQETGKARFVYLRISQ